MGQFDNKHILYGGDYPVSDPTMGHKSLGEYCQIQLRKHSDKVLLVGCFFHIMFCHAKENRFTVFKWLNATQIYLRMCVECAVLFNRLKYL